MFRGVIFVILYVFAYARHHPLPKSDAWHDHIVNKQQVVHPEAVDYELGSVFQYEILSVSPTAINNDEVVEVQFYSSNPSENDWIAAYSPPEMMNDLSLTSPILYGFCDVEEDYLITGYGSLRFNFTNLRTDIFFVYFVNGTYTPVAVNMSTPSQMVSFINPNEPIRPRMVPTGDYDIYTLVWSSNYSSMPTLKWGVISGVYTHIVAASAFRITKDELCGPPATTIGWYDLGNQYAANLTGMIALSGQTIFYSFGDDATNIYSREYHFFVPPAPGSQPPPSKDRGTTIIIYGDMGVGFTDGGNKTSYQNNGSNTWFDNLYNPAIYTIDLAGADALAGNIDAAFHIGDISYADGYLSVWDYFTDQVSPIASSCLYLTQIGNHESDYYINSNTVFPQNSSGGECSVVVTKLIPMPTPATTYQPWYSYNIGLMHLISMASEMDFSIGSPQYLWLENDLKNVNRTVTPWIIFCNHRPVYVNSDWGDAYNSDLVVMSELQESIEPLLFKYRVNLGVYGHNHVLQRQSAVYENVVVQHPTPIEIDGNTVYYHNNPQATVHTLVGTGGADFSMNTIYPFPDWNELAANIYGFARVEAVNATSLFYEFVDSTTGLVSDRVLITQTLNFDQPWPNPLPSSKKKMALPAYGIALILLFVVGLALAAHRYYVLSNKKTSIRATINGYELNVVKSPLLN